MGKTTSQGTVFKVGAVVVGNLTGITPPGPNRTEIDVMDFASTTDETIAGILTLGDMGLSGFYNYADAGQLVLLGDANSATAPSTRTFVIEFTTQAMKYTFNGWVKSFVPTPGVNDAYDFSATIRVTTVPVAAALP